MSAVVGQPAAAEARLPAQVPQGIAQDLLLLALLWCASLVVVNPLGDFPLNDDWSFGLAVKRLLASGDFRPTGWTSMPLITQTLWGALFCLPGGFSFTALRFSTLAMSLGGVLAVYLLMRQVHPSRLLSVLSALTVAFNPIYYALSNSFMTDAFFVALMVIAALFFSRNLQSGSNLDLLCGIAFALAATLCRQLGLAVPLAFGISLLCREGARRKRILRAVAPLAVCALALFAFHHWLRVTGRLPTLYSAQGQYLLSFLSDPIGLVVGVASHIGTALLYLGWFSLPILLLVLPPGPVLRQNARALHIAKCAGGLFLVGATVMLLLMRGPMPVGTNILLAQGIGPLTLRDTHLLNLPHVPGIGNGFWYAVTGVSLFAGALLVGCVAWLVANRPASFAGQLVAAGQSKPGFLFLCAGAYLFPILVIGGWDRYYLPALPFLLAGAAAIAGARWHDPARPRLILALVLLLSLSLLGVLGTKDYLGWNRVRWTALNELLAGGKATPKNVDGGFEFNGYYLYDPAYQPQADKSGWWVQDDTFLLSFGEIPGWSCDKEYRYRHWLPPYGGRVLVLKKETR